VSVLEWAQQQWNFAVDDNPAGASFDIGDKLYRIKVRWNDQRMNTFDKAYAEVASLQGMLYPTAFISTRTDGHGRHSVALMHSCPGEKMIQALNSWGTKKMHMEVTPTNFLGAMWLEPEIVSVKKDGRPVEIPAVSKIFAATLGQGLFGMALSQKPRASVGATVGAEVGAFVGSVVGAAVGMVGAMVGAAVGASVGVPSMESLLNAIEDAEKRKIVVDAISKIQAGQQS
jgi:hypothetical protein